MAHQSIQLVHQIRILLHLVANVYPNGGSTLCLFWYKYITG